MYVGQNGVDVSVIDTGTKNVTTISTGASVRDLAITPDGTKLYLAYRALLDGVKEISQERVA